MSVPQADYKLTQKLADIWDVITCPNGHPCYLLLEPIYFHSKITSKPFMAMGEQEPIMQDTPVMDTLCWKCMTPVFAPDEWPNHNMDKLVKIHVQGKCQDDRG